jgi:hypothetical protein
VKRVSEGKTSWLRLDRSDENNAQNITDLLGVDIAELHFSGTGGSVFFGVLSDGTLRKLDIGAKNISSPISDNVTEFQLYKDNKLAFVSKSNTEQMAAIYTDGDKSPYVVKRIKDLSNGQESFGDPGSDQWIKAFEEKYGRKPEGNKTSNMAKNIVGGFVKGTVLGTITGGFTGAIQNSLIYGIASPTISTFAESFIDDKPILKV